MTGLKVRGPSYLRDRRKVPAEDYAMRVVNLEVCATPDPLEWSSDKSAFIEQYRQSRAAVPPTAVPRTTSPGHTNPPPSSHLAFLPPPTPVLSLQGMVDAIRNMVVLVSFAVPIGTVFKEHGLSVAVSFAMVALNPPSPHATAP